VSIAGLGVFSLTRAPSEAGAWPALAAALPILPMMAVAAVISSILQSLGRLAQSQAPNALLRPVVFLSIMAAVVLSGRELSPASAVAANGCGVLVALVVSSLLLRLELKGIPYASTAPEDTKEWRFAAGSLLLVSLGQFVLSTQTDILLVGIFATKSDAGFYAAAGQLSSLTYLGVLAVVSALLPRVATLFGSGDLAGLQNVVDRERRTAVFVVGLPVLMLIAGGPWLLLVFGPDFRTHSYPLLLVLLTVNVVSPIFGNLGGYLLTLTGHQAAAARIMATSAIVYLALALIMGWWWGAPGVACATVCAYLFRAVMLDRTIVRLIGIHVRGVPRKKGHPRFS
jgi:O-antigen/teichoic acid export membrane protein